jgi:hypothetical protein
MQKIHAAASARSIGASDFLLVSDLALPKKKNPRFIPSEIRGAKAVSASARLPCSITIRSRPAPVSAVRRPRRLSPARAPSSTSLARPLLSVAGYGAARLPGPRRSSAASARLLALAQLALRRPSPRLVRGLPNTASSVWIMNTASSVA